MHHGVIIALGSSLGDRARVITLAVQALDALDGTAVRAVSRLWSSVPMGACRQGFINAAVRLDTVHSARDLLARCQAIERRLGRRPARHWADRVIDLDILLFGERRQRTATLELPHPGLLQRSFALEPAREVGADLVHPLLGVPLGCAPAAPAPRSWPVGSLWAPSLAAAVGAHYKAGATPRVASHRGAPPLPPVG